MRQPIHLPIGPQHRIRERAGRHCVRPRGVYVGVLDPIESLITRTGIPRVDNPHLVPVVSPGGLDAQSSSHGKAEPGKGIVRALVRWQAAGGGRHGQFVEEGQAGREHQVGLATFASQNLQYIPRRVEGG